VRNVRRPPLKLNDFSLRSSLSTPDVQESVPYGVTTVNDGLCLTASLPVDLTFCCLNSPWSSGGVNIEEWGG